MIEQEYYEGNDETDKNLKEFYNELNIKIREEMIVKNCN